MTFVHLHAHSAYSLSEGAITIDGLAALCRAQGAPAVAVTDTNNLFGALEASETLSAAGVQPISGTQQSFMPPGWAEIEPGCARPPHLVLLAQNDAGFRNLMRLSSCGFLESVRADGPCVDLALIEELADGVICLTGGHDGPVDRLIRAAREDAARDLLIRLAKAFPDRLYVELQRFAQRPDGRGEAFLLDEAYAHGLPIVATNEPFFPTADDYDAHDALLCIADGAYVHQEDRRRVTPEHYFKSPAEMAESFADLPEAVATTMEVARRCAFRPRTRAPILPRFAGGPEDADAAEASELQRQAREGLSERLAAFPLAAPEAEYWERLERELGIIERMGFPGYFLIVADFIKWAKGEGIPVGPGRGSGAGSLVAYALTITDLDPLRFGLLFERFLNPERVSMPDFDIDFCQDRRDEVIRYVRDKYGRDRVAQIITFGKLQARAVLRDVGRVIGMPFGQVDRLCKLVPNNPANPVTLAEALEVEPRLKEERGREEIVDALITNALKLEGLYRHASTHAAGVVIGDRPLDELTPLYLDPRADMPATQYNMKWVEPAGLVKFDFLGLKTLTVVERAAAFIRESAPEFDPARIALDDRRTYEMLGEGSATGVFQLESAGMRATLRGLRPDCLEDIIALISLYRPGPMENIPTYIDRKFGRTPIDYLHPSLEPVLKETYGVIIYQEQVMQIAQILSGYSLGEADLLRRAMGKKKKEEMDRQRKRFVDGAKERGVDPGKASGIFDLVQKFAGYGFNKSHAAAYGWIAYQTAYLKANHPAEFLAASMSLDRVNTDKLATFVAEARRCGVDVLPPDVNASLPDFSVDHGKIRYGLAAVKGVGEAAVQEVVSARCASGAAFADLFDLAERAPLKSLGKRSFESLARAGAFDRLGVDRAAALANADLLVRYSARAEEERVDAQRGLFDAGPADGGLARPAMAGVDPMPRGDVLNEECAALGFYFSGHPLDEYTDELARLGASTFAEAIAAGKEGREEVDVGAIVKGMRLRRSKAGKPFAWIECSDASGDYEATAFSEVLERSRDLLEPGKPVLMRIAAEDRDGEVRLTCEGVRPLDAAAAVDASRLRVRVASPEAIDALKRRLDAVRSPAGPGAGDVHVIVPIAAADAAAQGLSAGAFVEVRLGARALCSPATRSALRATPGVVDVEIV
ncbi:MAG: DNA polymerase III subunit alpha [Alphaproteobacteria bacterium]|nr:DNA polymerase III subunit alpha [Alphaproteobacteria bacterium]